MNTTAEAPREIVLDVIATVRLLDQGNIDGANAMLLSYADTGELPEFMNAFGAVTVASIRYAAFVTGQTPERLLEGAATGIRLS